MERGTCPYLLDCFHRHYYKDEELEALEIGLSRFESLLNLRTRLTFRNYFLGSGSWDSASCPPIVPSDTSTQRKVN